MIWGGSPGDVLIVDTINITVQVIRDAGMGIEARTSVRRDMTPQGEVLSDTFRADSMLGLEALSTQRRDMPANLEEIASVRRDAPVDLEAISGVRRDAGIPLEALLRVIRDVGSGSSGTQELVYRHFSRRGLGTRVRRLFFTGPAVEGGGGVELELIAGMASVDRSARMPLEALGSVIRDQSAFFEALRGVARDASLQDEWTSVVVVVDRSAGMPIEWSIAVRRDAGIDAEAIVNVLRDAPIPAEFVAMVAVERSASVQIEWLSLAGVSADTGMPFEFARTPSPFVTLAGPGRILATPGSRRLLLMPIRKRILRQ